MKMTAAIFLLAFPTAPALRMENQERFSSDALEDERVEEDDTSSMQALFNDTTFTNLPMVKHVNKTITDIESNIGGEYHPYSYESYNYDEEELGHEQIELADFLVYLTHYYKDYSHEREALRQRFQLAARESSQIDQNRLNASELLKFMPMSEVSRRRTHNNVPNLNFSIDRYLHRINVGEPSRFAFCGEHVARFSKASQQF